MKKILLSLISLTVAIACFAGCSSNVVTFSYTAPYWHDNYSGNKVMDIDETLEYRVAVESFLTAKPYAPSLTDVDGPELKIDSSKSYYRTNLKSESDYSGYIYTTELCLSGSYMYNGNEYPFENDYMKTTTRFKGFADGFKAIKTEREALTSTPVTIVPSSEDYLKKIGYKSIIEYGKTAKVTITPNENEDSKQAFAGMDLSVEYKKYDKGNYIDNDLMLLMMRTFKFDDNATTFNYSFLSTDPVSGLSVSMLAQAVNYSVSTTDQTNSFVQMDCGGNNLAFYDGQNSPRNFTAFGVKFSSTGTYGQDVMVVYYATGGENGKNTRNCPIKIYQRAIYNSGYLTFTLSNAR